MEDQLDWAGAPQIEVLPNHAFEEHPARHRPIQHLVQRELGLEDGDLVAVAGFSVSDRVRMRPQLQPFA